MKKITAILMALVLISSFAFVVSAEGEPVNYAATGVYEINDGDDSKFLSSQDNPEINYTDPERKILIDGVSPYYTSATEDGKVVAGSERMGESIILTGSGSIHTLIIDLGATYDDIYEITLGNVWDSFTFGWELGENGQGNRGFYADKTIIKFAPDGVNFEKNDEFEVVKENHTEDGSENGYYDFKFKFEKPVTAKAIQLSLRSPSYCLSFSELQVWGYGHSIPTPEVSIEESSEEESVEESSEEAAESSEEESTAEESKTESKAEESKTESKAEESKGEDEKDGPGIVVFIVIGVAVVAVVAVVIVVLNKKKQ